MAALGYSLEILVWLLPWSIVATRFALSFNEPSARLGGMPWRVWALLLLAWSWLVAMPLWPGSGFASWLGTLALVSAPLGALLEMLIVAHRRLRPRRTRPLAIGAGVTSAILVLGVVTFVLAKPWRSNDSGAISRAEFDSVKSGQSEASVLAQFGRGQAQYDVEYSDPPTGYECIYYSDSGYAIQGGTTYRLCFHDGVLVLKDGFGDGSDNPASAH